MKHILGFLLLFTGPMLFAQTFSGRVIDSTSNQPIPFVNITVNGSKVGTASDIDGRFYFNYNPDDIRFLEFSSMGYTKLRSYNIADKKVYKMKPSTESLDEVVVFPGVNPAHRIIQNATANKEKNRPENLSSFSYKTYSKLVIGLNVDSVENKIDTIVKTENDSTFTKLDSSAYEMHEFANQQYALIMETVTKRSFVAPSRDNETVLAQRTSGFKNPLFSLIATQLQSFNFYGDYFSMVGEDFLNPLTKGSTNKYFFVLKDTTYNDAQDTVYTISFWPKPNYTFRPMRGQISINTRDWAIQNVIAAPVWEENENGFDLTIQQNYKKYGERTWFPKQLNATFNFGKNKKGGFAYGDMRTYLNEVEIEPELRKRDISMAKISIDELATENADALLNQYRTDSLSEKEKTTYHVVDSIGEASNFERQITLLTTFMSGKIPLYVVDLELDKIVSYNTYEGFRLGLSLHTNSRFSRWFKTGGYFAYGFSDKVWKYGYDASVSLNKVYNLKLYGGYSFDITETGKTTSFLHYKSGGLFADNYRQLFVEQFDENSKVYGGITFDPSPQLNANLRIQRENRYTIGDYRFLQQNGESPYLQNGFTFTEAILGLRWAPKEEVIEAQEYGRITLNQSTPQFFLDITKSLPNTFDNEFDYVKVDFKASYTRKSLSWGRSIFDIQAGKVFTDAVAFSKLYAGNSNQINSADFFTRANAFADRSSFETMFFNEFLNDAYIQLQFRQDFRSTLLKINNFAPHIEVVTRAMWGMISNPDVHQNIRTQDLRHGYYESGLELNKLYKLDFTAFGLAFFYRYGPYSLPEFSDNFIVKFTSKFSF
jgi:hypothetical protein